MNLREPVSSIIIVFTIEYLPGVTFPVPSQSKPVATVLSLLMKAKGFLELVLRGPLVPAISRLL